MDQINLNNNKVSVLGDLHVMTNMTQEEIKIVFPSGNCSIPHSGFDRCCVSKLGSQPIPVSTEWTDVTWNDDDYDNNDMHSVVLNHQRITIKRSGLYVFLYKVRMESNDKCAYDLRLYKNGTEVIPNSATNGVGSKDSSFLTLIDKTPLISLVEGDYVLLQAKHDCDSSQNILPENSFLACERRY